MKISEMLFDAAKYPLSGLKQMLLLGFMILISSLLLGDYNDYSYLNSFFGNIGLLTSAIAFLIVGILFFILEAGYPFKIIEKSLSGSENPPKLNNFSNMFKHGIYEIIIGTIYFLIPLFLFLVILDDAFSQITLGLPAISDEIAILMLIGVILLGFLADIIFTVAIPHMASKGESLKDAFRLDEIFKKIRKIGFKKLIIGYLIVILGVLVIGGPILKQIIGSANIFGFVIAEELIAPYIVMFSARFSALIYMESV